MISSILVSGINTIQLHRSAHLVRPAHPLDGKAGAHVDLVVVLGRGVHNGGDQELLVVLVGVDQEIVLSAIMNEELETVPWLRNYYASHSH